MNCKDCKYCKNKGRTSIQNKAGCQGGRKQYYCEHPKISEAYDKYGYPIYNFIGFGDATIESPLKFKTNKKWCPIKRKMIR